MSMSKNYELRRTLLEERLIGYLDPCAESYLMKLNGPFIRTTSSCTGRITIVEGEWHWLRDSARIVFKTHSKISVYQLASALAKPFDNLWLKVTGPIIHARVYGVETVRQLMLAAREAGFKHSGIMYIDADGKEFVVEMLSAVQLSMPLRSQGLWIVRPDSLSSIVDMANSALEEGWRRLARLSELAMKVQASLVSQGSSYMQGEDEKRRNPSDKGPCSS
ncbi:tRNA(Phe) 7-((3-amino-3-carboxypropyl)-4-demethylwyosine(37)-N(4))-methyltransferase [Acidilobus saccharovorans]|uniref:tRNA(Phe) 7-((3-amino-3-carboxypropyl)-4-demethylwyosine(37)-N(4))- methyltransferase n=1 Tax=Acidilobus saccharovorans TaxID=242703 RepID=UPI000A039A05|nr:hypothetical protein [Acidilobus saccharovorans]